MEHPSNDTDVPKKGRKPRACKRPRKTQTESIENTAKRKTRASTMSEILHTTAMYTTHPQGIEIPASYAMSQSTRTVTEVTQTSSGYSAQLTAFHMRARVTETFRTSSAYSPQQRLPHPTTATVTMAERNIVPEMSQNQVSADYSTRSQMPESPVYHAMAERTRAAKKLFENRSSYATQSMSVYSTSQRRTTSEQPNTDSPSANHTQMPHLSASPKLQQTSGGRYYTRQAAHKLPKSTAADIENYWSKNTTRRPMNQVQNINNQAINTKEESVQTDISMTEIEAKLLKILRTKQMDPSKISMTIDKDDYTITYTQVQDKEVNPKSINTIVRSSDLIKTSLMKFYNNVLQQRNIESQTSDTNEATRCENPFLNTDHSRQASLAPAFFLQNSNQSNETYNPQPMPTLLSYNQSEIQPPAECFEIPTVAGNRSFTDYTNSRYSQHRQQGPRSSKSYPNLNSNIPSDFLRFAQFMEPRFVPPAMHQTFEQFGSPRWF